MTQPATRLLRALIGTALAATGLTGCGLPLDALGVSAPGAALGYVKTNLDPEKTTVAVGEVLTLWVETGLPDSQQSHAWTATAGTLSARTGPRVRWTAGGSGRVMVRCTITAGGETRTAEYLFTVR